MHAAISSEWQLFAERLLHPVLRYPVLFMGWLLWHYDWHISRKEQHQSKFNCLCSISWWVSDVGGKCAFVFEKWQSFLDRVFLWQTHGHGMAPHGIDLWCSPYPPGEKIHCMSLLGTASAPVPTMCWPQNTFQRHRGDIVPTPALCPCQSRLPTFHPHNLAWRDTNKQWRWNVKHWETLRD